MDKQKKTQDELKAIVMQEIREHPGLHSIQGVLIERPLQQVSPSPNWRASWIVDGPASRPAEAEEIVRRLQSQFDLTAA